MYVTLINDDVTTTATANFDSTQSKPVETRLKPNGFLFYEGDEVDWLYQVKSGVMRMTRLLEDGRRQVIAFGYPGDVLGFPADGLHHTDCQALTEVRLQPFRKSALESDTTEPELHQYLVRAALREISAMQDHFMMLGRKSAAEKVASFLGVLSDRFGTPLGAYRQVVLPMSRADIADFLGLTTETVSRTLTQLRKCKVIAIENNHTIIILRPTALAGLSRGDSI